MKRQLAAAAVTAILLWGGAPASAHRLDEYLQATTISVAKDRIHAEIRLTPGVAVFRKVFATIDTDGNSVISASEQRAYAERVLGDLSLSVDGQRLPLHPLAWKFAETSEMKAGRGEIELDFDAAVPAGNRNRKLVFDNHHQNKIAAYLVNCLVPTDPDIQVTGQTRDYQQSHYELDYVQANGAPAQPPSTSKPQSTWKWFGVVVLLFTAPVVLAWRQRIVSGRASV